MRANHNQINVMFADKPGEHLPDIAYTEEYLVLHSSKLFVKTRCHFFLQLFLLLNMDRPGFRRTEEVIFRRHNVGTEQPRTVPTSDRQCIR